MDLPDVDTLGTGVPALPFFARNTVSEIAAYGSLQGNLVRQMFLRLAVVPGGEGSENLNVM